MTTLDHLRKVTSHDENDRIWLVDLGIGIPGFWLWRCDGIWKPEPNQYSWEQSK